MNLPYMISKLIRNYWYKRNMSRLPIMLIGVVNSAESV